jgi:hypothetical protein
MRQAIRNIVRESRRKEFFWRYGFNFLPSLNYRLAADACGEAARRVVRNLDRDGIAVASVDELPGAKNLFAELESKVAEIMETRRVELDELKSRANRTDKIGEKTFNVELLGSEVEFEPESVFARFALQESFLDIADSYFKMLVKLRYYNVWNTFATSAAPRESQLWHYDREDNYILKIFVYLKDVGDGAGPFTYAPKTHRKGVLSGKEPEYFVEKGVRRTTDEQMAAVVAPEKWIKGTGKKGTIIFADTRGFHKGGEARTDDRLMFTCMFTSPASQSKRLLKFPPDLSLNGLNEKQISALEI